MFIVGEKNKKLFISNNNFLPQSARLRDKHAERAIFCDVLLLIQSFLDESRSSSPSSLVVLHSTLGSRAGHVDPPPPPTRILEYEKG